MVDIHIKANGTDREGGVNRSGDVGGEGGQGGGRIRHIELPNIRGAAVVRVDGDLARGNVGGGCEDQAATGIKNDRTRAERFSGSGRVQADEGADVRGQAAIVAAGVPREDEALIEVLLDVTRTGEGTIHLEGVNDIQLQVIIKIEVAKNGGGLAAAIHLDPEHGGGIATGAWGNGDIVQTCGCHVHVAEPCVIKHGEVGIVTTGGRQLEPTTVDADFPRRARAAAGGGDVAQAGLSTVEGERA